MPTGLFAPLGLSAAIEENETEVARAWTTKMMADLEFSDVAAEPVSLILGLAQAVRLPQAADRGAEPAWLSAVADSLLVGEPTIGVMGCKLRCLIAAIEDVVLPRIAEHEVPEALRRLYRVAYLGLEYAARVAAKQIAALAYHSPVTALRNRPAFEKDANRILSGGAPLRIVYLDMDGLKAINDAQGHAAGNEALRKLAEVLSAELGPSDTAYHLSGDEFAILSRETDLAYISGLMTRAYRLDAPKFSFGTALIPDDHAAFLEAVDIADKRMLEQKKARKARGEAPERGR